MDELHHECGIAGAVSLTGEHDVTPDVALMVAALEHRGGLAAGIAKPRGAVGRAVHRILGGKYGTSDMAVYKSNGHVRDVLTPARVRRYASRVAIGHTRYATSDSEDAFLAQPWEHRSHNPQERLCFAWNGTVANADDLRAEELSRGTHLCTHCDTELLLHRILRGIREHTTADLAAVFGDVEHAVDGSFNIVVLLPNRTLAVYRDGQGRNTLETAVTSDGRFLVASEDWAERTVDPGVRAEPVPPGQLTVVRNGKIQTTQVVPSDPKHCFFQWTYFDDWRSRPEGLSVEDARIRSGQYLAEQDTVAPAGSTVVIVPDSARLAGLGYALQKQWPYRPDAIRNLLPGQRTFTTREPARTRKAEVKYGLIREILQGKSIVLVEDSLVRGTTMRALVNRLRVEGGVREIHLRIACPPILAACYYGIDFPEIAELIARKDFNGTLPSGALPPDILRKIAERLGVDSIQFLPVEDAPRAIGCDIGLLCMACVTGKCPTACGQRRADAGEAARLRT